VSREVEFSELVGLHELTGVDRENEEVARWGDEYEPCEVVRFVLDGKTYTALENPSDGYRSGMRSFVESDATVKNTFPAVRVMAIYKTKEGYTECDILDLVDVVTGLTVLSVGTNNSDDYYPSFVGTFNPENMCINRDKPVTQ
jgi:hypothetical protein